MTTFSLSQNETVNTLLYFIGFLLESFHYTYLLSSPCFMSFSLSFFFLTLLLSVDCYCCVVLVFFKVFLFSFFVSTLSLNTEWNRNFLNFRKSWVFMGFCDNRMLKYRISFHVWFKKRLLKSKTRLSVKNQSIYITDKFESL